MKEQKKANTAKRFSGWVPDLPDNRDKMYGALRKAPVKLPSAVDLRPTCSLVEDQGHLGSCTGNALVAALEFLEMKHKGKNKDSFIDLSRLFIYYNERVMEHTVRSDPGAMLRDGIKTLAKKGVCSEKSWPYVISKFAEKPPESCYKEALTHKIKEYARIQTIDEMRACLADGYPFVFGFSVYESFHSEEVEKTGIVQMPKPDETLTGGHAVLAVGYDDSQKRFIVRNSWGVDWGMEGYFTIPYEYLGNDNLASDFWTIRVGDGF